ncbi:uncharacterized protein LOC127900751 [Citrus sinensis]|uniref:uncharacterized protein LOC127900751 n=1 Tax=Citrus sinensis TaxID=2711 RepID=UPI002278100A|nr:uncharacterized protein LOC127900751 [Citrus sinensis]
MEADSYPIDYIACATTPTDLLKLRTLYNIPEEILLVIPGKDDVPSRPPRGYVTMHLQSFKLGARLPLQRYFAKILGGMHLAPESWGLIKELEDRPLLQVETALVNASTCQDLLSSTNLVGLRLVDVAAETDNKILSAMTRKRGWAPSSSSNPPPSKKTNVCPPKASVPALPPPPPRKNGGEKVSDKSPEVSIQSGDQSSPIPSREQGDYLSPYQRDYDKLVGPKMVKDIESMNLVELAGSVQRVSFKLATLATQSKRDTLKTALEGEIKSVSEQLAETKGKSADVDDRLDAEYDSGRYMAEADQGSKEQDDQDQTEAPLGGVQVEEAGDRAPEIGQGSVPPPPDVGNPPLPEIADPSTVEAADPHNL